MSADERAPPTPEMLKKSGARLRKSPDRGDSRLVLRGSTDVGTYIDQSDMFSERQKTAMRWLEDVWRRAAMESCVTSRYAEYTDPAHNIDHVGAIGARARTEWREICARLDRRNHRVLLMIVCDRVPNLAALAERMGYAKPRPQQVGYGAAAAQAMLDSAAEIMDRGEVR